MDTASVSGPGRQLAALVPELAAHGVELRIVVFQRTGAPKTPYRHFLEAAGIDPVVVPFASRFDRRLVSCLRRTLEALAPDFVQTHNYRPTVLAWLLTRRRVAWRWIGFFHGATYEDLKVRVFNWFDRRMLPSAERVVVMAQSQVEYFGGEEAYGGRKLLKIYNAVLPRSADAEAPPPAALLALSRPRVGVVGRLSPEKGVDVLLQAFARVRVARPSATLTVAGDGPERANLEAEAARLGIGDAVTFLGTVLPVEPLYPQLDLIVLPSRSEGLPNVLLEALRAGRPVVATRVGAVPEVLDGSDAGLTVAPDDPEALAEAIDATLAAEEDPVRRTELTRARAVVVDRFSLTTRVQAHLSLYATLRAEAGVVGG
jgi:glycosyltransferase involved in cell wall biosynthesis